MKQQSTYFLIAAAIIAVSMPAAYILYLIFLSGDLSNFDYWWITWNFYGVDGFSPNPLNWIFRANEHFLLIPSILYALNIAVTQGSNIGLSLITWFLAWIQCHILIAMLPLNLRRSRLQLIFLILCISIFTFTPAAAHNWMRGFSGVAWMSANLFAIAAIFCLKNITESIVKSRRDTALPCPYPLSIPQCKWVIGSIIFALLASISYSTSLALWPVLCIFPVLLRLPRKITISYITIAILVVGTYFFTYKTPANSPSLAKLSIVNIISYIPVYLGGIFSNNVTISLTIGIVGLIAATTLGLYWLLSNKSANRLLWLPWLSIQVYAIATAFMAAVAVQVLA